jgi:hypothetical protein
VLLGECFYSIVVEDSGLLGCDAVLPGECFCSGVVENTGVLGCDAELLGVSTVVWFRRQVFWDVMLCSWVSAFTVV